MQRKKTVYKTIIKQANVILGLKTVVREVIVTHRVNITEKVTAMLNSCNNLYLEKADKARIF